jgi:hypothetical protein
MTDQAEALTPTLLWLRRFASGLIIALLLVDALMNRAAFEPVIDTLQGRGFSGSEPLACELGITLLACTLLYAFPRTAALGALLLTSNLRGAIAVQLRAGSPWFSHVLFGGQFGMALWAGLLPRSKPLRSLLLHLKC